MLPGKKEGSCFQNLGLKRYKKPYCFWRKPLAIIYPPWKRQLILRIAAIPFISSEFSGPVSGIGGTKYPYMLMTERLYYQAWGAIICGCSPCCGPCFSGTLPPWQTSKRQVSPVCTGGVQSTKIVLVSSSLRYHRKIDKISSTEKVNYLIIYVRGRGSSTCLWSLVRLPWSAFCENDVLPVCFFYSPNILRPMGPSLCLVEGGFQGTNPVMGLQS